MWLEINSHIDSYYGYYHGLGSDAGLYAFNNGSEDTDNWIIAPSFDTWLYTDNYGEFNVEPYTYNEAPVFRNEDKSHFIFKSVYNNEWILFERLQEPISYYALDLSTFLGDGWYQLDNAPIFTKDNLSVTITARPKGVYTENAPNISVINRFECFKYDWDNGQKWYDYPLGLYKNQDGTCRVLGTPIWITRSPERSMTRKEVWALSGNEGSKVYGVGSMNLAYNNDLSAWVIGTEGSGRWYIGGSQPRLDSTVHYDCFEMVDGQKKPVLSSYVDIKFYRAGASNEQTGAYFGEVSQWY